MAEHRYTVDVNVETGRTTFTFDGPMQLDGVSTSLYEKITIDMPTDEALKLVSGAQTAILRSKGLLPSLLEGGW